MEIWKWVSGVIIEDDNDTSAFQEHSVIRFLWILLPDFSSHISLDFVARFFHLIFLSILLPDLFHLIFLWILLTDFRSPHISLDFVARFVSPHIAQRFHFPARGPAKHVPLKTTFQFFFFPDLTSLSFFKKRSWRSASRECENL